MPDAGPSRPLWPSHRGAAIVEVEANHYRMLAHPYTARAVVGDLGARDDRPPRRPVACDGSRRVTLGCRWASG